MGNGRVGSTTEERGEDACPGVGSDAIAGGQKQSSSLDPDMTIRPHIGSEVRDPPGTCRTNTAYDVEVDCTVSGDTGNRNDSDAALEFHERGLVGGNGLVHIIGLSGGDAAGSHCHES